MIFNLFGVYLELPTVGYSHQSGQVEYWGASVTHLRGDMRLYLSNDLRVIMRQAGIASITVQLTIDTDVSGAREERHYSYTLTPTTWVDLSEVIRSAAGYGRLDQGDASTCGSVRPSDLEWPPVPYPYSAASVGITFSWQLDTEYVMGNVNLGHIIDTPPYEGVAPIIDRYGSVRVVDVLDENYYSIKLVVLQGGAWRCVSDGHHEACRYVWLTLSGQGEYGQSSGCGEGCWDECTPPSCPAKYDCTGAMVIEDGCAPVQTRKRMVRIRYVNVDGLTIERWCEAVNERIEGTQTERAEVSTYSITNSYTAPASGGWHSRTRNETSRYLTVAWRGFPMAEMRRIAEGITCTSTCIIIDGEEAWFAVLSDSFDIEMEDGGDLELELELRPCPPPWEVLKCKGQVCDEEIGCTWQEVSPGEWICVCPV